MARGTKESKKDPENNPDRRPEKAKPPLNGSPSGDSVPGNKRGPRGALLHGDDPTLAKRVEEELSNFGR